MIVKYKPDKKNVPIQLFVRRMKEKCKTDKIFNPPNPGENFQYIVVKNDSKCDIKGRNVSSSKGDNMEYVEAVRKYKYDIEVNYYIENVNGILKRYISIGSTTSTTGASRDRSGSGIRFRCGTESKV